MSNRILLKFGISSFLPFLVLKMKSRILLIIIIFLTEANCFSQTRRALVIGIGEQEDSRWGKINGDKDIPIITEMLVNIGYKKSDILTLVNKQATKERIVSAFNRLAISCKPKDVIYIHFSGHGQRVTDVDGDEKDSWDESWIPYDAYRDYCVQDRGEKHLIDDEIYRFLFKIKEKIGANGKMLVVADACHSGGSSYNFMNYSLESKFSKNDILKDVVIRGISTPFKIPYKSVSKKIKKPEQWLMLSACNSFEFNQELTKPCVGILSYALYLISKRGRVEMHKIENFIKKNKGPYPQTPVLIGETGKYSISDVLK